MLQAETNFYWNHRKVLSILLTWLTVPAIWVDVDSSTSASHTKIVTTMNNLHKLCISCWDCGESFDWFGFKTWTLRKRSCRLIFSEVWSAVYLPGRVRRCMEVHTSYSRFLSDVSRLFQLFDLPSCDQQDGRDWYRSHSQKIVAKVQRKFQQSVKVKSYGRSLFEAKALTIFSCGTTRSKYPILTE
jgi:hypothetical protein